MRAYCFRVTPAKPHPAFLRPWLRRVVAQSHFAAYVKVQDEFSEEFPGVKFRLALVDDVSTQRAA